VPVAGGEPSLRTVSQARSAFPGDFIDAGKALRRPRVPRWPIPSGFELTAGDGRTYLEGASLLSIPAIPNVTLTLTGRLWRSQSPDTGPASPQGLACWPVRRSKVTPEQYDELRRRLDPPVPGRPAFLIAVRVPAGVRPIPGCLSD